MKAILVLVALCVALAAASSGSFPNRETILKHTLYNTELLTAYPFNPVNPPKPNEEQLCYLVGVISGCSGCSLGTQNLCSWVGRDIQGGEFHQCVPRKTAEELVSLNIVWDASYECPANPEDERDSSAVLWSAAGNIPPEETSLIHNTYHEMLFGDVDRRPWAVYRTALYSEAGAFKTWGVLAGLLGSENAARMHVTCADLNDPEALSTLYSSNSVCLLPGHELMDELVQGVLTSENDAFCLKAIWASYLSTRCPEYGVAVSGITQSLWTSFVDNCAPAKHRDVNMGPTTVQGIPYSIFGLPVVPDGTPFALAEVSIPVSAQFEEYTELEDITIESSANGSVDDVIDYYCVPKPSQGPGK